MSTAPADSLFDQLAVAWEQWRRAPRPRERASFYFQLRTLLDAGRPLPQALRTAAHCGRLAPAASRLAEATERGEPLADAMRRERSAFDPVETAVVRAGEVTGRLAEECRSLAARFEAEAGDREEIRAGLRYPLFLLHFAIVVLPIPTIVAVGFGAYLGSVLRGLAGLYGIAAVVLVAHTALRANPRYAALLDVLPLFGRLRRARSNARFARTFATLHAAGLPFDRCLAFAGEADGRLERRAEFDRAADALRGGGGLLEALALLRHLPSNLVAAFATGEQAGRLEETLGREASEYDRQARLLADRIRKSLPLAIYLAISFWIAWRVVAAWAELYREIG